MLNNVPRTFVVERRGISFGGLVVKGPGLPSVPALFDGHIERPK